MRPQPREDLAFVPLKLPKTGEELVEGRQYVIDPVARAVIVDRYGIRPPKHVECIHAEQVARKVTQITEYADGRPTRTTVMEIPHREPTFRGFFKYKKTCVFQVNLAVVESLKEFYVDAPIEPDDEVADKKATKQPKARTTLVVDLDALMAL